MRLPATEATSRHHCAERLLCIWGLRHTGPVSPPGFLHPDILNRMKRYNNLSQDLLHSSRSSGLEPAQEERKTGLEPAHERQEYDEVYHTSGTRQDTDR